ncbi:sporulation protein YqfC [Rossellomorea marisflavi]
MDDRKDGPAGRCHDGPTPNHNDWTNPYLYIENHRGLLTFADDEVRLLLKQGQLLIKGEQFVIKIILPEEILLQGKVVEVIYLDE